MIGGSDDGGVGGREAPFFSELSWWGSLTQCRLFGILLFSIWFGIWDLFSSEFWSCKVYDRLRIIWYLWEHLSHRRRETWEKNKLLCMCTCMRACTHTHTCTHTLANATQKETETRRPALFSSWILLYLSQWYSE